MPTHYQIIVTHLRAVVLAVATIAASLTLPVLALAQAAPLSAPVTTEATLIHLPTFRIVAETIRDDIVQAPFMSAIQGVQVFAGKKSIVIDFDAMPQIQTDNYRQAFSKTPGLLTSELSNSSLLSLSYRGIGDPHESQNLLVLKDGIPFVLDPFGYPTVYYAPPFESVDRLEFVAGGGSLLYGPQPSGALNYVTHIPSRTHAASLTTQHIVGSDSLYSTFSTLEGGVGRTGYLAQFDHRSGDSFRDRNSDFALNGGSVKLVVDAGADARVILDLDAYKADSGEPGGLTLARGAGFLTYADSRTQTQNLHDRLRVERLAALVRYERDYGSVARLSASVWVSDFSRYSKRQNGSSFGRIPTASNNTINLHEYSTVAADVRYRRDYGAGAQPNTFTAGFTAMSVVSPISNRRGATADADDGIRTYKAQRQSRYLALFGEHLFRRGKLAITPGIRLEMLRQRVDEQQNDARTAAGRALLRTTDNTFEPLGGIGATYEFGPAGEFYGNVSTAYKPAAYGDLIPTGAGDTVSDRLEPGRAVNYEFGWRARPAPGAWVDVSVFAIDYDNRFGRVGSNLQNVGRSLNRGLSAAAEIALWRANGSARSRSLSWHGNAQFLDAKFISGPLDGRTPQYAPRLTLRSGLVLRLPDRLKIALLGTYLGEHFADDANTRTATADWLIPAYTVFDLTAEAYVWRGQLAGRDSAVAVLGGINNLLDEHYWSRVRSNGIDPANGRNYYAGLRVEF